MSNNTILVTGAAGFIGCELTLRLLARGDRVIGVDNLNPYYDVGLKDARVKRIEAVGGDFKFHRMDLADREAIAALFRENAIQRVVNLAAQPGVRYSITHPQTYIDSNLLGFANLLEGCRHAKVEHLVFASSSSVYGANTKQPFREGDNVDHPVSLYAATKKANELMAHTYAHLYGLPTTGLRFFTVYGPWGRPDMAYFSFTRKILAGEPIPVFNHGRLSRDFTYIDDIVEGVIRVLDRPASGDAAWNSAAPNPASSRAPYRIFNIGNHQPVPLMEFIATLEQCLGRKAEMEMLPMQDGDVEATYADTSALMGLTGFQPATPLAVGLKRFTDWYRSYYG
jgi:UDP-glucuronate 4-epimerase